jgi:diguanylate cyclase (GGDEF)-like protein/PAS domain S-box-containing protein
MQAKQNSLDSKVYAEQVRILYEGMSLPIIVSVINALVLAVLLWSVIEHNIILIWLAALLIVTGYRLLLAYRFRMEQPADAAIEGWSNRAQISIILTALCWGVASYYLFAENSLPHQVLLSFIIAGTASGAITTLSPLRWTSSIYVLLAVTPLIYRYFHETHQFAFIMGMLVALFVAMLIPIAGRVYRNLEEMLVERFERQLAQLRDQSRNQVLELLAKGAPLREILTDIVLGLERENPGMMGSILLLDEDGSHLVTGAAPSLPAFYNEAINGVEIGDGVGSCGTAAYKEQRVIVDDIQSHPYWKDYSQLAAEAGVGACWSEPVFAADKKLLGTFAIYHRHAQSPTEQELSETEHTAHLAGIAIEHHRAQERLRLAGLMYQNTSEAVMILDSEDHIVSINAAFTRITGFSMSEAMGQNPTLLNSKQHDKDFYQEVWSEIVATGRWQGEVWNRHKDGSDYAVWFTIDTIYDETRSVWRRVALFSDITDNKKADALIWEQAHHDNLTGLPNRRLFFDRLEQGIKAATREGDHLALLFIDLDRFKEVNDAFGHHRGDELLVEASKRITGLVRDSDTVARVGGDEFTVILPGLKEVADAGQISQKLIEALNQPFELTNERAFISASIGIAICPDDASHPQELFKDADQAMYAAKQVGRNSFSYFTSSMQENSQHRMHLVQDMHSALISEEFSLHYQPIVDLATNSIYKAEALLRWNHPRHGYISPTVFIPIAEETGIIHEIGNWVFKEVAEQVRKWRLTYYPDFRVSINRSPMHFFANSIIKDCCIEYMSEINLPGESIIIEITEGVLLNADPNVNRAMLKFRDAGIQVAIDDFGTGYSSLSYLKRFDIDYLKIDQSFISNLETDDIDFALSEAIIVMAHKLGFQVIAEGVETEGQRDILQKFGCDYAQGFLFSKPVRGDEFEKVFFKEKKLQLG